MRTEKGALPLVLPQPVVARVVLYNPEDDEPLFQSEPRMLFPGDTLSFTVPESGKIVEPTS